MSEETMKQLAGEPVKLFSNCPKCKSKNDFMLHKAYKYVVSVRTECEKCEQTVTFTEFYEQKV